MVCDKCEKKLSKVAAPEPWKSGPKSSSESSGRKIGENKLLTSKKSRWNMCYVWEETDRDEKLQTKYCLGIVGVIEVDDVERFLRYFGMLLRRYQNEFDICNLVTR
ncbi:unnamed protein product [Allacma fusca]|uniref:Cysteine-rich PDZ-binding protein n=1 Tax=Allacma fusca TaxID=39272 RepID=A0A8J2LJA2_9HEXA|nr:unnamed protein product [Allacma fusca]